MQLDRGAGGERAEAEARGAGGPGAPARPPGGVRVLIVDGHDRFRAGLASLLNGASGITVVAQASEGEGAARLAGVLRPDVVLADVTFPDLPGPEGIRAILARHPDARIIALTLTATEADVLAAIAAGACGHVGKDAPIDEITAAVRAAAEHLPWLSPRSAQDILTRDHQRDASGSPSDSRPLSSRERDVLGLIADGRSSVEVAVTLLISLRAVYDLVAGILAISASIPTPASWATEMAQGYQLGTPSASGPPTTRLGRA